jgi:hypothetical protein
MVVMTDAELAAAIEAADHERRLAEARAKLAAWLSGEGGGSVGDRLAEMAAMEVE